MYRFLYLFRHLYLCNAYTWRKYRQKNSKHKVMVGTTIITPIPPSFYYLWISLKILLWEIDYRRFISNGWQIQGDTNPVTHLKSEKSFGIEKKISLSNIQFVWHRGQEVLQIIQIANPFRNFVMCIDCKLLHLYYIIIYESYNLP